MTTAAPPAGLPVRLVAAGALAFLLLGMLPAIFGVALPGWRTAFALPPGAGGTVFAAYNGGAAAAVLAGAAGLGTVRMRPALLAVALGAAALALGPGWGPMHAGAALAGIGYGALAVAVNRRMLLEGGPRGPALVALVNAVYGMGAILAPLVFLLADQRAGPPLALVAALALAALALTAPEARTPPLGLPSPSPRLLALLLNFGAVAAEALLIGLGAAALVARGLSAAEAARLASLFFAAFVAARLLQAALGHRLPPARTFQGGLLGVALSCLLAATVAPGPGFALAGGFAAVCFPAFFVWSSRLLGPDPRMGALILASGLLAGTLGPVALRPILGRMGEAALFPILAAFAAALALAAALAMPRLARLP